MDLRSVATVNTRDMTDQEFQECLQVAAHNARLIRRTLALGDPSESNMWFGRGLLAAPETLLVIRNFLDSLPVDGVDPVAYCALAPWLANHHELTVLGTLLSQQVYWLVRPVVRQYPPDMLWQVVSRPGKPGYLEQAIQGFPANGGSAYRVRQNTTNPAIAGEFCTAIGWLLDSWKGIEQYGVLEYWDARYRAWVEKGEWLKRKDPDRKSSNPSIWDLIERTADPLTDPVAAQRSTDPLRRFLGLSDAVPIEEGVAAGYRPNFQHRAEAQNAPRGSVKLKGTFTDIVSAGPLSYTVVSGDYFHAEFHYDQHAILLITSENFERFKALFPSEQDLRDWWFDRPRMKGAPPLEVYREFGCDTTAVDEDGRYMGREIKWRKSL